MKTPVQLSTARRIAQSAVSIVLLIGVPTAFYFAYYVSERVERTTIRNFRALDTAAERLTEIFKTLPQITSSYPASSETLDLLIDTYEDAETLEKEKREKDIDALQIEIEEDEERLTSLINQFYAHYDSKRYADSQSEEFTERWRLNEEIDAITRKIDRNMDRVSVLNPQCEIASVDRVLKLLRRKSDSYKRGRGGSSTAQEYSVHHLYRKEEASNAQEVLFDRTAVDGDCSSVGEILQRALASATRDADVCIGETLTTRLYSESRRSVIEVSDCRSSKRLFSSASRGIDTDENTVELQQDPSKISEEEADEIRQAEVVFEALDQVGLRIKFDLENLSDAVFENLDTFFDELLLVSATGEVLYTHERSGSIVTEKFDVADTSTGVRLPLDFATHANIAKLLPASRVSLKQKGSDDGLLSGDSQADEHFGEHSALSTFVIGGIGFSAFIQPVEMSGIDLAIGPKFREESGITESMEGGHRRSNGVADQADSLYVVGIVATKKLDRASLKLRRAGVTDALQVVGIVIAAFSLLWLWTAGDKILLSYSRFVLLTVAGAVTCVLVTLFVAQLTARTIDGMRLDGILNSVATSIRSNYESELNSVWTQLQADERTLNNGENEKFPESRHWCTRVGRDKTSSPDPRVSLAFLVDPKGVQTHCISADEEDVPRLDLSFREYVSVPSLGIPWSVNLENGPVDLFVERVTSVLDGAVETVISKPVDAEDFNADGQDRVASEQEKNRDLAMGKQVVAAVARFHSLEDAVLPPHYGYAVIDRSTGDTLYHSINSRSLASNIYRDSGGDSNVRSHVLSPTRSGYFDFDYNGVEVRSVAIPLVNGLPWTLLVYRSPELEDTVNSLSLTRTGVIVLPLVSLFLLATFLSYKANRDAIARQMRAARLHSLGAERNSLLVLTCVILCLFTLFVVLTQLGLSAIPFVDYLPLGIAILSGTLVVLTIRTSQLRHSTTERVTKRRSILVMTCFFLNLAIFPTIGSFLYAHEDIGRGVASYATSELRVRVDETCVGIREQYPRASESHASLLHEIFLSAWPLSGLHVGDRSSHAAVNPRGAFRHGSDDSNLAGLNREPEGPRSCVGVSNIGTAVTQLETELGILSESEHQRSFFNQMLAGTTSFSALSTEFAARAFSPRTGWDFLTLGEVYCSFMDEGCSLEDIRHGVESHVTEISMIVVAVIVGLLICISIVLSIVNKVLVVSGARIYRLSGTSFGRYAPGEDLDVRGKGRPRRLCFLHQSEYYCRAVTKLIEKEMRGCVRSLVLRSDGQIAEHGTDGEPLPSEANRSVFDLYVVIGFDRIMADVTGREKLRIKLEELYEKEAAVLLFSRTEPQYWLQRAEQQWLPSDRTEFLANPARLGWGYLFGALDTRRLEDRRCNFPCRLKTELEKRDKSLNLDNPVHKAMYREAKAFPQLHDLAAFVAAENTFEDNNSAVDVEVAYRQFMAGASHYFDNIWSSSYHEEQLQLSALSGGGFLNPDQLWVLSSLINRGLIEEGKTPRLRSPAFGEFVSTVADREPLEYWRRRSPGGVWKTVWPPLAALSVLIVAFFLHSTPEAIAPLTTVVAAGLGLLPLIGVGLRGLQDVTNLTQSSGGDG